MTTKDIEEIVEKMLKIGWDPKLKKHDGTTVVVCFSKAELVELLTTLTPTKTDKLTEVWHYHKHGKHLKTACTHYGFTVSLNHFCTHAM